MIVTCVIGALHGRNGRRSPTNVEMHPHRRYETLVAP
jgi:hypothetical protein